MIRPPPSAPAPTPAEVARHYDDLDRFYRAMWGDHIHHGYWATGRESPAEAVEALVDLVAARLDLRAGEALCDVGCGYGATARRLAARHGVVTVGITLSRRQAAIAATQPGLAVALGDWTRNPFADVAFDAAVAVESTEHMESLEAFCAEAYRCLRPGGRLAVCAWLSRDAPSPWTARRLLEPIRREGRLVYLGTARDYEGALRAAGFDAVAHDDLSRAVARTWTVCIRRLAAALASDAHGARRFLLDRRQSERVFAATLLRIRAAYAVGALRYGLFSARKP